MISSRQKRMELIFNEEKKRREECKNKTYKLIGFVNMFEIIPDFVRPVFVCEQDDKAQDLYYIQEGDDETLSLNSFYPLKNEHYVKNIILLEDILKNDFVCNPLTIDSKPIFAFHFSKEQVVFGDYEVVRTFLKDYSTDDSILKEQIQSFIEIRSCKTCNTMCTSSSSTYLCSRWSHNITIK